MSDQDRPPADDAAPQESDATPVVYDANGVDRTLIRWMLGLTPTQRLEYAQGVIDLVNLAKPVRRGDR